MTFALIHECERPELNNNYIQVARENTLLWGVYHDMGGRSVGAMPVVMKGEEGGVRC